MNLPDLLTSWDADATTWPTRRSRTSQRTLNRETAAGHQPRERLVDCQTCRHEGVLSVHAVCDDCGPATCGRCQPETAYRQAVTS